MKALPLTVILLLLLTGSSLKAGAADFSKNDH